MKWINRVVRCTKSCLDRAGLAVAVQDRSQRPSMLGRTALVCIVSSLAPLGPAARAGVVVDVFPPNIAVVPGVGPAYAPYQLEWRQPDLCPTEPVQVAFQRNGIHATYTIEVTSSCSSPPPDPFFLEGTPLPPGGYDFHYVVCYRDIPSPGNCLPDRIQRVEFVAAAASEAETVPASGAIGLLVLLASLLALGGRRIPRANTQRVRNASVDGVPGRW